MMEHESEPTRGLPGPLPQGEQLLWQGRPDWWALAQRAFHVRAVAVYFLLLMAWRAGISLQDGQGIVTALVSALWLGLLGLAAIAILGLLAWLSARSTVYTVTSRRLVIRSGVALQLALNIPYKLVGSAGLRSFRDGTGDIPLSVLGKDRVSWMILWPHVRPWRLSRPEPMLRAVPDAARVAEVLSAALAEALAQESPHAATSGYGTQTQPQPAAARRPRLVNVMGNARA